MANLAARLGRIDEARRRLKQLAAAHPESGDVEMALADIEAHEGDRDAALAHYRSATGRAQASWAAWWGYALLLEETGAEPSARIEALNEVVRRNPDLSEARIRLAGSLNATGKYSEALEQLQRAKPARPGSSFPWSIEMALAAFGQKQIAQAREYLEQARNTARTPEQKAALEKVAAILQPAAPKVFTEPGPDPDRPTLRHNPPPAKKR
jgi:tetratricopeptide (TPR) repeat protein